MDRFARRPWLAGLVVAAPLAVIAAWFTSALLVSGDQFAIDLGPASAAALALAALITGVALASRVAREDLGTFSGLVAYFVLAELLSYSLTAVGGLLLGAFAEDGAPLVFVLSILGTVGATLLLWVPAGIVWVAAVRRLTIPGLRGSTELEFAESEAARDAAAREHVVFDATNVGSQGSKLRRNRT
jgi:hypothetical protein